MQKIIFKFVKLALKVIVCELSSAYTVHASYLIFLLSILILITG